MNTKLKGFPSLNYISIFESQDRRDKLHQKCEEFGIENVRPHIFERITDDYCNEIASKFSSSLHPKKVLGGESRYLSCIGALTSHLKAIKEWYENTDEEYAFFCEDDLSFETVEYWNFTWEEFIYQLPKNWQCAQLSLTRVEDTMFHFYPNGVDIRTRCWCDWSCCAYLIKRSHAKNIVEHYFDGDDIILEYQGFDYELRKQTGIWAWYPSGETFVYTNFQEENLIYVFPLFVEDQSFHSTYDREEFKEMYYSYNQIINWWKTKGKKFKFNSKILDFCILRSKGREVLSDEEYIKQCLWERDFILDEIFCDYTINDKVYYIDEQIPKKIDVLYFYSREFSYDDVKNYLKLINPRPKIIISCVDEAGTKDPFIPNMIEFNKLSNYCDLLLRQHHHEGYTYGKNVLHIPLGYNNNFNSIDYEIKKIKDRNYIWSHFGAYWKVGTDRPEMIEKFSNISPHFYSSLIPVEKVKKYYSDSIFVPCGRGNVSLNCFRLYEASMSGAIPIIVGSEYEIDWTFFYEDNPPWLFFETWDQAFNECLKLLEDKDKLQEIQDKILIWWKNRICSVKAIVNDYLKTNSIRNKLKNFPPVNFISIQESKDRQKKLYENFEKYGVHNVTPYIYKKYNDDEHNIKGKDIDILAPKKHRGPVTSHLKAIKEWYENTDEEYAFFCEDDLSFETVEYWNFTWEEFFNKIHKNWECVQLCFLSTHDIYADSVISFERSPYRYRDWCDWSCCAYLIKRSHAKNIVEHYFDGDDIILEYQGFDYDARVNYENNQWLIPAVETIVYTYFIPNTIYIMPLFLESLEFNSTWTDGKNYDSFHEYSHNRVLNWWKITGSKNKIDSLVF